MDLMGYTYPYNLNSDNPETLPPPTSAPLPPSRCQAHNMGPQPAVLIS